VNHETHLPIRLVHFDPPHDPGAAGDREARQMIHLLTNHWLATLLILWAGVFIGLIMAAVFERGRE
jgi:hypothetical protein